MSDLRGRTLSNLVAGLNAGQHLAVDAVVAFVDGELGSSAHERATQHLTTCQICAAEVAGQQQARSMVRSAGSPRIPTGLLAALRDIPQTVELPGAPDDLAVADDGTVVAATDPARSRRIAPLGAATSFGSGPRWGSGPSVLGRRIGRMGAGAVVSGLLGALIMIIFEDSDGDTAKTQPGDPAPTSATPTVIPAAGPMAEPGAGTSGDLWSPHPAQPGWDGVPVAR